MQPDISIIIPLHNRGDIVRYTLESVRRASSGLTVEVIIVDDGSDPPVADSIAKLGYHPERILRQANRGLLFARLAGMSAAGGRHVLFLDSDDLISPDKLRLHVAALEAASADVSYSDTAQCVLEGSQDALSIRPDCALANTEDCAELFIRIQPAPHSPVFRTAFIRRVVAEALFPPSPHYNPVAEIWFYHNAAIRPARVVKVHGPHAIVGRHPGARLTDHWEILGVASLGVQEAFARHCPIIPETEQARRLAAEKAFVSWRRLPIGFSPEFARRQLAIWRRLQTAGSLDRLGGRFFQVLAHAIGPVGAAQLLRLVQGRPYQRVRTMDNARFRDLLAALPES
jgi:hypothetical protein